MPIKFKLKIQLAMKEMTQKQLAEVTGIRPPTISSMCTGTVKQIPVYALERICDILDCQPGDIMEYVPEESMREQEQIKKFRRLDRRVHAISQDKMYRNEYPVNEYGAIVIPALSDIDRPDDVSPEEWAAFMAWKFGDEN